MFYEYCTRVSNTHDFMGNLNCGFAASGVIRDLADHGYGGLEAAVVNFDLPAQDQSLATRERASVL